MSFETYEETRLFAGAIRRTTQEKSMPPWFADSHVGQFSNDPSLRPEEIGTLAAWAEAKSPAGDTKDARPSRRWAESWSIPKADLVLKMTQAVALPASGDIEYTYEISPRISKRIAGCKWRRFCRRCVRTCITRLCTFARRIPFTPSTLTDPEDRRGAHWTDSDILLVYAPGSSPGAWPEKMAKFIPSGSDLVFQIHYIANGRAAADQSRIELIFSKHAPELRVLTLQLTNDHFVIPPGAPDYRVEARGTLPNDATLFSFFPHMHLRGKRFEYNLIRKKMSADGKPDDEIEPLLRVNYHFHWQMSYRLAEPRFLRAGTELQAVAWYDNSKANPHNPDAHAAVRWGEQTYDEMMVGFFDVGVPAGVDKQHFFIRTEER
ncbi:MAG TPA: thiol-disulfide isomerase [Candidatus Limnocylindria bacterium]|jgi:hypothetical protein|nr:thiol-disulfide isomerase [Candidatus Limnocylindria bacterium]